MTGGDNQFLVQSHRIIKNTGTPTKRIDGRSLWGKKSQTWMKTMKYLHENSSCTKVVNKRHKWVDLWRLRHLTTPPLPTTSLAVPSSDRSSPWSLTAVNSPPTSLPLHLSPFCSLEKQINGITTHSVKTLVLSLSWRLQVFSTCNVDYEYSLKVWCVHGCKQTRLSSTIQGRRESRVYTCLLTFHLKKKKVRT